jgi:hypothetical protein
LPSVRIQGKLLDRKRWRTRVELANALVEHVGIFHNRQRRHSSLGELAPLEVETRHLTTTVARESNDPAPRTSENLRVSEKSRPHQGS